MSICSSVTGSLMHEGWSINKYNCNQQVNCLAVSTEAEHTHTFHPIILFLNKDCISEPKIYTRMYITALLIIAEKFKHNQI